MSVRRTPLTPIFDPKKQFGAVEVGNTPPYVDPCLGLVGSLTNANFANCTSMIEIGDYVVLCAPDDDSLYSVEVGPETPTLVDTETDATDLDGVRVLTPVGSSLVAWGNERVALYDTASGVFTQVAVGVSASYPASPDVTCSRITLGGDFHYIAVDATNGELCLFKYVSSTVTHVATVSNAALVGCTDIITDGDRYLFASNQSTDTITVWDLNTPASPTLVDTLTDATNLDKVSLLHWDGSNELIYHVGGSGIGAVDASTRTSLSVSSFEATVARTAPQRGILDAPTTYGSSVAFPVVYGDGEALVLADLDDEYERKVIDLEYEPTAVVWADTDRVVVLSAAESTIYVYDGSQCGLPLDPI